MNAPHPAAAPLLNAARELAAYEPTGSEDLARLLRALHDLTGPSVLGLLSDALGGWANEVTRNYWANGELLADRLRAAAERPSPLGEAIDKARADTGHWDADDENGDVW